MISGPERARRLHVIREEYAKGWGGALRAAEILGLSYTLVRKLASLNGIVYGSTRKRPVDLT